jgi:hypothetical protein
MSFWIADSNISPPAWISSAEIWSLPGDLYFFNFAMAISTLRRLGPGETYAFEMCESIFKEIKLKITLPNEAIRC